MRRLLIAALLLAAGVVDSSAQGGGASAPSVRLVSANQGRDVARAVCAECHAVEPGRLVSPNAEAPAFEFIANTPGMNRTAMVVFFNTPHRMMPNLVLGRQDADNIIDYILSLKR